VIAVVHQAVAHTLRGEGHDASEDGTGRGVPLIPVGLPDTAWCLQERDHNGADSDAKPGHLIPMVGVDCWNGTITGGSSVTLRSASGPQNPAGSPCVAVFDEAQITNPIDARGSRWRVRRLMPVECERLQGFPDGYTDVPHRGKPASDGPRYKALGNSMAVNVMRWIGQRIDASVRARRTKHAER
jgi:DNA (cytosine-5)-methyltransferase 1